MNHRKERAGPRHAGPVIAVALACVLAVAGQARAAVKPPPLPPGSSMVRVQAGMNPDEVKRQVRAHHNKTHYKKDLTRDDSVGNGNGNGNGNSNANANQTNPGRKP